MSDTAAELEARTIRKVAMRIVPFLMVCYFFSFLGRFNLGVAALDMVEDLGLYLMRFLLGAAQAGFFPGVILYLTYWFPASYRARFVGWFMVAIPVSSFLGSPLSAALLGTDGWMPAWLAVDVHPRSHPVSAFGRHLLLLPQR
jgi:MFS family permease